MTDTPSAPATLVAYYRVSTERQGLSRLGIEAQQRAVAAYVASSGCLLLVEFTEIESGRKVKRPELQRALAECRRTGAVLVIAKLDRLARNVAFLSALMDGDVDFRALDLPGASRFVLHILAAVAEQEADAISARTKAALQSARARGTVLGRMGRFNLTAAARRASADARRALAVERDEEVLPNARRWRDKKHMTLAEIADELNELKRYPPPRGKTWRPEQVRRLLERPRAGRGHESASRARPTTGVVDTPETPDNERVVSAVVLVAPERADG